MSLLTAEHVTVRFGGHVALDDVSLSIAPGCITGLIGPNGAGKTTMFDAISGVTEPTSGKIGFDGRDITKFAPHQRARLGIGRTFQRLEVFSTLSVRDNVRVGVEIRQSWSRERGDPRPETEELLARTGITAVADLRVDQISTGRARLVELARSLAIRPRALLLDEPASGLDESETEELGRLLTGLAGDGLAVLLVEHDVAMVMRVCEHISVLDLGRIIAEGDAASVQRDPAVLDAYLGHRAAIESGT